MEKKGGSQLKKEDSKKDSKKKFKTIKDELAEKGFVLDYKQLAEVCNQLGKTNSQGKPFSAHPNSTLNDEDAQAVLDSVLAQMSPKASTPTPVTAAPPVAPPAPPARPPQTFHATPAPPPSHRPADPPARTYTYTPPPAQAPKAAPVQHATKTDSKDNESRYKADRSSGTREVVTTPAEKKPIPLHQNITVKELAEKMSLSVADVIKTLFMRGIVTTVNHSLELETAEMVVHEHGFESVLPSANPKSAENIELERKLSHRIPKVSHEGEDPTKLRPRPPVVTIMGHVDHGKTSLLDYIRKSKVAAGEAGGITQRIGAAQVMIDNKPIVFLDTPGHEAFTAMRARGASVTDIVVLVVAADDGIMPQTIEAINHAKASGVTIIVAINKIDKDGADPERIKQQLTEYQLVPEEWGGDTVILPVSAKSGQGVDELLEMILLVAEIAELKANPFKKAQAVIIESRLDRGRGPVGTVLIQSGTLRRGDHFVVGPISGKVRAMTNEKGQHLKEAPPATPVEIIGFSDVPRAGEIMYAVESDKKAKEMADKNRLSAESNDPRLRNRVNLTNLYENVKDGKLKELNIVLKADVHGSVDAIRHSLERLSDEKIQLKIIHAATGELTESDIMLASASNALAVGFNVKADSNARRVAAQEHVEIRLYEIIYRLTEDVQKAMEGLLQPAQIEVEIGHAEVRAVFSVGKGGMVAGCYIQDGRCERNARMRVWRQDKVVYTGKVTTLKRFKDDVKEVGTGYECGISSTNYNEFQTGDRLEFFLIQSKQEASR